MSVAEGSANEPRAGERLVPPLQTSPQQGSEKHNLFALSSARVSSQCWESSTFKGKRTHVVFRADWPLVTEHTGGHHGGAEAGQMAPLWEAESAQCYQLGTFSRSCW